MTLEETARQALDKTQEIQDKAYEIMRLAGLVLTKHEFNGDTLEYDAEDKQKLIQHAQSRQVELEQLVTELHNLLFPS